MLYPRKRFGQNFLHDPGTIARILAAIGPKPRDRLVEIGPGRGAITHGLLAAAGRLDVVELDRDLIPLLAKRFPPETGLTIHNADALAFDLCALLSAGNSPERPAAERLRLVGNLPYNISTPLLFRFLGQTDCIQDMHLMLQKEVVERIAADPGGHDYGRLSVGIQAYCQVSALFTIGPGAFTPAPKVESAFLRLTPYRPPPHPVADRATLTRLVAQAFSQRRKTLRNTLKGTLPPGLLEAQGIDPGQRAEEIPVEAYIRLANAAWNLATLPRDWPPNVGS
jgi:16S rRNA (adenine1518-N6/adenine1519-N6)-dimethyltransferase